MSKTTKATAQALGMAALLVLSTAAQAGDKTYQVTGPVVDVSSDSITVKKGSENWQIAKDAGTKTSGEPKKGDKVTVHYTMKATEIEAKPPAAKAPKK